MKGLTLALTLVMILSITAVAANPTLGKAHIPFAFSINGQMLEPGDYQVRSIGNGLFRIENTRNQTGVNFVTVSTITDSTALKLIFRQYDEDRFLGEITDPVLQFSASFSKCREERIAEKRSNGRNLLALTLTR
jgi:hypothetical protein